MELLNSLVKVQPIKIAYLVVVAVLELFKVPFWSILYLLSSQRPHPKWTLVRAIKIRLFKAYLYHMSKTEFQYPLSLEPGTQGERFVVLDPAPAQCYRGVLDDLKIKPIRIGGTWYPEPYPLDNPAKSSEKVIMHMHGGAFVVGCGRDGDFGWSAHKLLKNESFDRIFSVQYRLAGEHLPGCAFPAAIQDVVTAYYYLVYTLRIPASNIIVSGDSAGGNLTVALLRYISEHGNTANLPAPSAALLWSPWVNVGVNVDKNYFTRTPQYKTDYLNGYFGRWGAREYAGKKDPNDPYITHCGRPFKTDAPIWMQTGDAEVLIAEDTQFYKEMGSVGNKIEMHIGEGVVHDILLLGSALGFGREVSDAVKSAGKWYQSL